MIWLNYHIIKLWRGDNCPRIDTFLVSSLVNNPNDSKPQLYHADSPDMVNFVKKNIYILKKDIIYSGILSLQGSKLILHDKSIINISKGSIVLFRGDYIHAGAQYEEDNRRFNKTSKFVYIADQ